MTAAFIESQGAAARNAVTPSSHFCAYSKSRGERLLTDGSPGVFELVRTSLRRSATRIFGLENLDGLRARQA